MGLINYTNLEDGTPVTANMFNQRFGSIVAALNGGLDAANFKAGGIPVAAISNEIYAKMWPIGSVYINATNNLNPGELLGFGTWVQFGAGRVPVGIDTAQTEFNAPEKLIGHKELQAHQHSGSTSGVGDHTHGFSRDLVVTSASGSARAGSASGQQVAWGQIGSTNGAGAHNHSFTTDNAGGGNAGNIQPSIVVYMWKRTG